MKNVNNIAQIVIVAVNPVAIGFAGRPEEGQAGDPMCGRFSVVS